MSEKRFSDYGGLGILHELDPLQLQYWAGAQGNGMRNIANDPEYIERQNKALYEACVEMRERRRRNAIYSIKMQPFFNQE